MGGYLQRPYGAGPAHGVSFSAACKHAPGADAEPEPNTRSHCCAIAIANTCTHRGADGDADSRADGRAHRLADGSTHGGTDAIAVAEPYACAIARADACANACSDCVRSELHARVQGRVCRTATA